MKLQNTVALVTGANRGIGREFVTALLNAGARKVYATARDRQTLDAVVAIDPQRVVALAKTSPAAIAQTVLQGIENHQEDIFPDPMSSQLYTPKHQE
jgi:NAD(P)-dependent dehydrogenase (short-subunit alcohol dehydrogenase family)